MHNVHNNVYRLKKTLKEAGIDAELSNTNEGYVLRAAPGFSDLERLRSFTDRTGTIDGRSAAEGGKLLRSYGGSLFEGKDYVEELRGLAARFLSS